MNDLGRLLHAWNMHRKEGILIDDVRKFSLLVEKALTKGDDKFFRDLAAEIQRQNGRSIYDPEVHPYYPETALKKVRYAYRAVTLEKFGQAFRASRAGVNSVPKLTWSDVEEMIKVTWSDVKETAIDLYDLKLTSRHWRRLREEAGLSELPDRPSGRKKNRGHRK